MSDRRLRDDLREYYLSKELSPATMERLKEMEAASGRHRSHRKRPLALTLLSAAAISMIAATLWIVVSNRDAGVISQAIANEVAMNHYKRLDPEFETASYAELRNAMDKLEFSLAEPARIGEEGLRLVGARYCSIQGQLAAQLRLETDEGESVTLYQTALTSDLEGLESTQLSSGGLIIDFWQEKGVFLGMAQVR